MSTKVGPEFRVNTYTMGYQGIFDDTALSNGNFVVTWSSAGQDGSSMGVYAQVFQADATKMVTLL